MAAIAEWLGERVSDGLQYRPARRCFVPRGVPCTIESGESNDGEVLLAYHGGGKPETREEQATVMAAWGAWMGELGAALVDGGNPVGGARTIATDGSVSDGGGANPVSGYGIIEAANFDAAVAHAQGCPILSGEGGSVEVCETFDPM